MKQKEIYNELIETAEKFGLKVRQEKGYFKSGWAEKEGEKYLVLNKNNPLEALLSVLVKCLSEQPLEKIYIKPAVREYVEKQRARLQAEENIEIEVDY